MYIFGSRVSVFLILSRANGIKKMTECVLPVCLPFVNTILWSRIF